VTEFSRKIDQFWQNRILEKMMCFTQKIEGTALSFFPIEKNTTDRY